MAWSIEGRYFENCSCEVVCPCTASLALGADNDYCRFALVFHVDSGEVEGVDVSGVTVVAVGESGQVHARGQLEAGRADGRGGVRRAGGEARRGVRRPARRPDGGAWRR